jgi:hypothetical protein
MISVQNLNTPRQWTSALQIAAVHHSMSARRVTRYKDSALLKRASLHSGGLEKSTRRLKHAQNFRDRLSVDRRKPVAERGFSFLTGRQTGLLE